MAKKTTPTTQAQKIKETREEPREEAAREPAPTMEPAAVVPAGADVGQGEPDDPPASGSQLYDLSIEQQGFSPASVSTASIPPQYPAPPGINNIILEDCYGTLDFYDAKGQAFSLACRTPIAVNDLTLSAIELLEVKFRKV